MKAGPVNDSPHALPICTVLTIAAAGSEMDCGGVISSMEANEKLGLVHPLLQPKVFSWIPPILLPSAPIRRPAAVQISFPIAEGMNHIFQQETLVKIGKKYGKSPAQVILRWNMQRDIVATPKSIPKNRMEENFAIWDFQLDDEDMADMARIDGQYSLADFNNPELVHALHRLKVHD